MPPTEPRLPETEDYVSGKQVETTTLIPDCSLLSAPDVKALDDEASSHDLPGDESVAAMTLAVQRCPESTGTVQSLIADMEISGLKVAALLNTGACASLIRDAILEESLKQIICMHQRSVKLQGASSLPTLAKAVLRVCAPLNGMKRWHHAFSGVPAHSVVLLHLVAGETDIVTVVHVGPSGLGNIAARLTSFWQKLLSPAIIHRDPGLCSVTLFSFNIEVRTATNVCETKHRRH